MYISTYVRVSARVRICTRARAGHAKWPQSFCKRPLNGIEPRVEARIRKNLSLFVKIIIRVANAGCSPGLQYETRQPRVAPRVEPSESQYRLKSGVGLGNRLFPPGNAFLRIFDQIPVEHWIYAFQQLRAQPGVEPWVVPGLVPGIMPQTR